MTVIIHDTRCSAIVRSGPCKGQRCPNKAKTHCTHCGAPLCGVHKGWCGRCGLGESFPPAWLKPTARKLARIFGD